MSYTVNKLAKMSGISVRTLHFYDEIGLLKPAYEKDLINSGKVTQDQIDKSNDKVKHWTEADWEKFKNDGCIVYKELVQAIENGLNPDTAYVQKLTKKHYEMISHFWTPTRENYIGLSQLYCSHSDFVKFHDDIHPKLLKFLIEAMKIYAEKELS